LRPYPDFTAIAVDPNSSRFAMAEGQSTLSNAMEQALRTCSRAGPPCQLYALGDTIVHAKPQHEIEAIAGEYLQEVVSLRIEPGLKSYRVARDFKVFAVDRSRADMAWPLGRHRLHARWKERFSSVPRREKAVNCTPWATG
jgi:hypothetical protein